MPYSSRAQEAELLLRGEICPDEDYTFFLRKSYSYVSYLNKKIRIHSYIDLCEVYKEYTKQFVGVSDSYESLSEVSDKILLCINDHSVGTIAFKLSEFIEGNRKIDVRDIRQVPVLRCRKTTQIILVAMILDIPGFISESDVLEHLRDNLSNKLSIKCIPDLDMSALGVMRSKIRSQAGSDYISLSYSFDGVSKIIDVPRVPFERWVLKKPEMFFLTDNWVNIVPSGHKRSGDNQDHSDWLYGSALDVSMLSITGEYKPLHVAASHKAFKISKSLTQVRSTRLNPKISNGFYSFHHKKIKKFGAYLYNEEIGDVFILDTYDAITDDMDLVFVMSKIKNANLNKISFVLFVGLNENKKKEAYLIIGT